MGMFLHYHLNDFSKPKKAVVQKATALNVEENKVEKEPVVEIEQDAKYSKSDIARMNVESLKSLAQEVGIEDAENKSGSQLKKDLVEYFNL